MQVAAAIIKDDRDSKCEAHESLAECVARECAEELSIDIEVQDVYCRTEYSYDDRHIEFTFFTARIISGVPTLSVHRDFAWVSGEELKGYTFCPADVDVVKRLQKQEIGHSE